MTDQATILIIDDSDMNGNVLQNLLKMQGHEVEWRKRGSEGLTLMRRQAFDILLLDIMMPEMSGFDVLEAMQGDDDFGNVMVLMVSALSDFESVVRCINLGASDYIPKPINNTILKTRIKAALEKKRHEDQERAYLQRLELERSRSERLLLNILPSAVAERLKMGERNIADTFEEASVLFADIVGFSTMAADMSAMKVVDILNRIFSRFDQLADKHGLEKIKTIGDGYMGVSGVPQTRTDHAEAAADMALEMMNVIGEFRQPDGTPFTLRIGISSGPVVAGIIGRQKFSYDLWGDTVNVAKRMEENSRNGTIHISADTRRYLNGRYQIEPRDPIEVKGKGRMQTFFLNGQNTA